MLLGKKRRHPYTRQKLILCFCGRIPAVVAGKVFSCMLHIPIDQHCSPLQLGQITKQVCVCGGGESCHDNNMALSSIISNRIIENFPCTPKRDSGKRECQSTNQKEITHKITYPPILFYECLDTCFLYQIVADDTCFNVLLILMWKYKNYNFMISF